MASTVTSATFAGAQASGEGDQLTLTLWEHGEGGKRTKRVLTGALAEETRTHIKNMLAGTTTSSPGTATGEDGKKKGTRAAAATAKKGA